MRYYTFTIYGVVTAGLATLFFVQLPSMSKPGAASRWIRVCGAAVAVVCWAFEVILAYSMIRFRELMAIFGDRLPDVGDFGHTPDTVDIILFMLSFAAYLISFVAWIHFAELPPTLNGIAAKKEILISS